MAWTSPRTWLSGETLTAALMNVHLRDNLKAIGDPWTAWTPTVTAESGTFTTVSGAGRYIAAGKLITFSASITITTVGTAASSVKFTLPVAALAVNTYIGGGRENTTTGAQLQVWNTPGSGTGAAYIIRYDNASAIAAGRTLIVAGTYEAA